MVKRWKTTADVLHVAQQTVANQVSSSEPTLRRLMHETRDEDARAELADLLEQLGVWQRASTEFLARPFAAVGTEPEELEGLPSTAGLKLETGPVQVSHKHVTRFLTCSCCGEIKQGAFMRVAGAPLPDGFVNAGEARTIWHTRVCTDCLELMGALLLREARVIQHAPEQRDEHGQRA